MLPAHPFSGKDAGSGWERTPHARATSDVTAALCYGRGEDVAEDRSRHGPHWPRRETTNLHADPELSTKKHDRQNYAPPPSKAPGGDSGMSMVRSKLSVCGLNPPPR